MREAKIVKPCPQCKFDLAEFMKSAQVNIDMAAIIGNLQRAAAAHGDAAGGDSDADEDEEAEEEARIAHLRGFPRGPDASVAPGGWRRRPVRGRPGAIDGCPSSQ